MNDIIIAMLGLIIGMLFVSINHLQDLILENRALILEYQSKLTAVETEKQKTIAEFLKSVKTGEEGRNGN